MPLEHLIVSQMRCMSTFVDAIYKFILPLKLVMRAVLTLFLMTPKQHGSVPETPRFDPEKGDISLDDPVIGVAAKNLSQGENDTDSSFGL